MGVRTPVRDPGIGSWGAATRVATKNRSPRRLRFFGWFEVSPAFYGQVIWYAFETLKVPPVGLGQNVALASR